MSDKNVAIVTGGTRGIGLDISKALIADGYRVAAITPAMRPQQRLLKKIRGMPPTSWM